MLALHGAWDAGSPGALVLWAEDGDKHAASKGEKQSGRSETTAPPSKRPALHPYAATAESIADALGSAGSALVDAGIAHAAPGTATVRLPARRDVPEASPLAVRAGEISARRAARSAKRVLRPFVVPALRVPPARAIDLLLGLSEDDAERLHLDASFVALTRVAELALEVSAAGRVVPGIEVGPSGRATARWQPLGLGRDQERLVLLARSLPPACRSLKGAPGPTALVAGAFGAFVDAVCREALTRPLVPGASPSGARQFPDEAWLGALGSARAEIESEDRELLALRRLVDEWRAPLTAPGGSWRLCFRLHEPDDPEPDEHGPDEHGTGGGAPESAGGHEEWRVELLLQAVDDPSLLVEAAHVWRSGQSLQRAARTLDSPQEVLLAELGRAVRAFPDLETVLALATPSYLETDLAGAHRFLAEAAPALELAGFGVLLPSWWRKPSMRLGARLRVSGSKQVQGSAGGRLSADALCSFDWEAALGTQTLRLSELRRLAKLKAPLVRVRGQWTELDPGDVERLVELLTAGRGRKTMSVLDAVRAAAGTAHLDAGVPVLAVEAEGTLGALLSGELAETLEVRETPEGFRGELRPYQRRGVAWIELLERMGLGACLADDMGLGKTATVLGVLEHERSRGDGAGPTLVVCPTSVVGNWQREVERFTPGLTVIVHHGATRPKGKAMQRAVAGADVVVTSYSLVERDRAALGEVPWRRIVLDEAQQVKNPAARQTQAVRAIPAPRRIALTGTPVENHLGELWSIMEILNPGLLGSQSGFREHFSIPIERYGEEEAAEELRVLTRPFILRRLKTDKSVITDLPEKLEMTLRCSLTREQATLYQAVLDEMIERVAGSEGIERKGLVLATMLRLKQVCNHPAQYTGDGSALAGRSGKLERLVEVLDEVRDAHEKALVFTQFAEMGLLLQRHLSERLGCPVGFLHGAVPRTRRDELVAALQAAGNEMPILVLSLKAGGTGLNLTAASHVLHYDRWWNPAVEDQATDRAYRIGQRRDVLVRKLVCSGTVEERIDEMIETKRALAARVVGTGEGWLTELSTEDLADVLRLSADAGDTL